MDFEIIPTDDPIVSAVIRKMYQRSQVGIKKYGTTMERKDLTQSQWLVHLQEEMLDGAIYCQRLLIDLENLKNESETIY
jgi:hypothetical protein